jgi:hypothetical protein
VLTEFKPKKSKYGFRVNVTLETLKLCATIQSDLKLFGGIYLMDYWLEVQNQYTGGSSFVVYINSQQAYEIVKNHKGLYDKTV